MRKSYLFLFALMLTMLGISDAMAQKIYQTELYSSMFKSWDSPLPGASEVESDYIDEYGLPFGCENNLTYYMESGGVVYGNHNVYYLWYADLTGTQTMIFKGTPGVELRVLMNRPEPEEGGDSHGGQTVERNVTINDDGVATLDVSDLKYVHLNCIKMGWNSPEGAINTVLLNSNVKPAYNLLSVINNGDLEDDDLSSFPVSWDGPNNGNTAPDYPTIVEGEGIGGSRCITVTTYPEPTETWHTEFYVKANEVMPQGSKYRLTMSIRADRDIEIYGTAQGEPRVWKGGFADNFYVTTEWKEYTWTGEIGVDGFQSVAFALTCGEDGPGNGGATFYFDNIEFGYVLSEEEPITEEFALESANPEDGSFNLSGNLKEFVLTFNQKVDVSSVIASLGNENLTVTSNGNSIILTRLVNTSLNGIQTLVVSNVKSENGDELDPIVLKYSFGATSGDAQMELIYASNFSQGGNNANGAGWYVNAGDALQPADSGSGCRIMHNQVAFAEDLVYIAQRDAANGGVAVYGIDDENRLTLEGGKTYHVTLKACRHDRDNVALRVQVLPAEAVSVENGSVWDEDAILAEDFKVVTPEKSSKQFVAFDLTFTPSIDGNYVIRLVPSLENGSFAGFDDPICFGEVKVMYIPDVLGIVESQQLAEALEAATETYNELTMEEYEGRYEGEDLTALKNLIEEVNANKANYTSPSVFVAKAEELAAATKAANDHKTACDTYDTNIKRAIDIVADNAENKFSKTDTYLQLKATIERYHASKTEENLGDEEGPVYTFDVLKNKAELQKASEYLANAVNVANSLFTEVALDADIQQGNCGIAVLVERNRLGARTLLNMGVEESDPLIQAVENSVTDDDALAGNIKTRITKELYSKLKDADNDVFGIAVDEYGDPITDDNTGELVNKSYDMTAFIKNPNIYAVDGTQGCNEWNIPGWTFPYQYSRPGLFTTWGNGRNIEGLPEDGAFTTWFGTCRMEQTITDLPAGIYVISLCGSDWSNQAGQDNYDVNGFVYCKTSDTPEVIEGEEEDREINFAATRTIVYGGQYNMDHAHKLGYAEVMDDWTGYISAEDGEFFGIPVTDGKLTFGIHFAGDAQYFFQHVKLTLVAPAQGFDYAKAYSEMQGTVEEERNSLYIAEGQRFSKTKTNMLPISLQNEDAILGFQLDVVLPEGMTLAKNEKGKNIVTINGDRTETHTLSTRVLDDGSIRIVGTSMDNDALYGNDGELLELGINIASWVDNGEYAIQLKDVKLTNADKKTIACSDKTFMVKVGGKLGDVNNDDEIDVTDVVLIIDDILMKNPSNYDASLADVNSDGYIDVTDVVMVIDAILGKIELSRGAELIDRSAYTAFQMDLTIPAGYVLESVTLTDIAKDSHSLAYNMLPDGRCRVVVCSMNNEALPGAWDEVISLNLRGKGDAQVNIDRAVFVTIDGERHELMMTPTSIAQISNLKSQASNLYDLQGRKVEKTLKGILIENGKKIFK